MSLIIHQAFYLSVNKVDRQEQRNIYEKLIVTVDKLDLDENIAFLINLLKGDDDGNHYRR